MRSCESAEVSEEALGGRYGAHSMRSTYVKNDAVINITTRGAPGMTIDERLAAPEAQIYRLAAEFILRLHDRREGRVRVSRKANVIESDDRDILRNAQAQRLQCTNCIDCRLVVGAENRGEFLFARQCAAHAARGPVAD
jgi:hypothetical protein